MTRKIKVHLNRVEGDLELELAIKDGAVTDAWCIGTMYRGFEQILINREPMDALAITPRICGICSTAHLYATVKALECASGITPPPNAVRVRNICMLAEEIQSDCRQTFLMFAPDLCHTGYTGQPGFDEITQAFQEMKGKYYQQAIINSREIIQLVAIFGGQWPHSSYMVPGGVTCPLNQADIIKAVSITDSYIHWFETEVIATTLEDWLALTSETALEQQLDLQPQSAAALLYRFGKQIGLTELGRGSQNLISYGRIAKPDNPTLNKDAAGIYELNSKTNRDLDQSLITEDISHSWFQPEDSVVSHPFHGTTRPHYDPDGKGYSWAKAPRYADEIVQTGPLAQLAVAGDPLTRSLLAAEQDNCLTRQFVRIHRQARALHTLKQQLAELLKHADDPAFITAPLIDQGSGYGMIEAARGSLGHWLEIQDNKISRYQIITPTAWNGSPRDSSGRSGHIESSLIGTPVSNSDDPVEVGHVIRSHDPCLVCTVHVLSTGNKIRYGV